MRSLTNKYWYKLYQTRPKTWTRKRGNVESRPSQLSASISPKLQVRLLCNSSVTVFKKKRLFYGAVRKILQLNFQNTICSLCAKTQ